MHITVISNFNIQKYHKIRKLTYILIFISYRCMSFVLKWNCNFHNFCRSGHNRGVFRDLFVWKLFFFFINMIWNFIEIHLRNTWKANKFFCFMKVIFEILESFIRVKENNKNNKLTYLLIDFFTVYIFKNIDINGVQ